jgi:hypothetical protein
MHDFWTKIQALLSNNGHGIKRRKIILKEDFYTFDNASQKNCTFFPRLIGNSIKI